MISDVYQFKTPQILVSTPVVTYSYLMMLFIPSYNTEDFRAKEIGSCPKSSRAKKALEIHLRSFYLYIGMSFVNAANNANVSIWLEWLVWIKF